MSQIEDQANYYKNLHLRDRSIRAVIHVENKDDEIFWDTQLQTVQPGHYHFVSQSRSEEGVVTNGCTDRAESFPVTTSKDTSGA